MPILYPTQDSIIKVMVDALVGPGKTIQDLPDQWVSKALIMGVGTAAYAPVVAAKGVYQAHDPLTATGDDLDVLCNNRTATVRRKAETKARVQFKLSKTLPATANKPIPAGSLITTAKTGDVNAIEFLVLKKDEGEEMEADYVFPSGATELIVIAECATGGAAGNLAVSTTVYPGMVGIDRAEVVSLVQEGSDREDDETLRARFLDELQNQEKGGTEADYEIWAKRVTGVVSARCIPLVRGNGTVDVIITGAGGIPTAELISDVQNYIAQKTPAAGASVLVKGPTPVNIDVTASIRLSGGYSFESVKSKIISALNTCIDKENEALVVRLNKLNAAIDSVEGVFNFMILAPAADIDLAGDELAIPGTITITEVAG